MVSLVVQAGRLSEFFEVCKSVNVGRGERFIKIEQVGFSYKCEYLFGYLSELFPHHILFCMKPPTSFLQAMEEYVKEAPLAAGVKKEQVQEHLFFVSLFVRLYLVL